MADIPFVEMLLLEIFYFGQKSAKIFNAAHLFEIAVEIARRSTCPVRIRLPCPPWQSLNEMIASWAER
jgi:hypothetical protein